LGRDASESQPKRSESAAARTASSELRDRRTRERELRKLRTQIEGLEAQIETTEARIAEIDAQSATPEVVRDGARMRQLGVERRTLETQLSDAYATWDEATASLDADAPPESARDRATRA
jgi:ATP-binding cassette, subfamily F, member 3